MTWIEMCEWRFIILIRQQMITETNLLAILGKDKVEHWRKKAATILKKKIQKLS